MANRRQVGKQYETMAAEYLIKQGYRLLERNYYTKWGEIDLILEKEQQILFVEVKYRRSGSYGLPEEAVDRMKMERIRMGAQWYLMKHGMQNRPVSFDVVAIQGDRLRHIPGAFDGKGNLWI